MAFLGSAGIELLGITTGFPFGRYSYTNVWQPTVEIGSKWLPLMLPFAWLLVVGASTTLCSKLRKPVLTAALLATMIDFLMEPVMTGPLRYWRWETRGPLPGGAAVLNPFGWFLTAYLVALLLSRMKLEKRATAALVLSGHLLLTIGIGAIAMIPR